MPPGDERGAHAEPASRPAAAQRALQDRCRHPTGTFTAFRPEDVEQSVSARFAQQVRRHPARVAVASRTRTLTYEALDRAASRLAHALGARRPPDERPIALLFEHDSAAIVGILGALKAGRAYVFLDPALPPARLSLLLEDAQAAVLVTNTANLALARALAKDRDLLDLDALDSWTGAEDPERPPGPDTLFSLLYTSGSTGQPKAVVQNHRNVLSIIEKYTNNLHLCPDDHLALLASCTFNTSVLSIFGALLNGATVHPFDLKAEGGARLSRWLRDEGITIFHSVPTVFRQLLDTLAGDERLSSLRVVWLGGEALSLGDVERYRERFGPDCMLVHGLGCTELSIVRLFFIDHETPLADGRIPVGYSITDREVLILDQAGRPVDAGQTGEIVLRSRFLALGYWRRPDLTRQAFLPDPEGGELRLYRTGDLGCLTADGCLTHLGRKDFQVKIRGHRVEVAEVERALLELPGVREAAVATREDPAGEQHVVAYIVPASRPAPTASALRDGLAEKLPAYMVPSAFVTLDELPLTDTGKVDRRALPAPVRARELPVPPSPPRTPIEEALVAIWSDVLTLDQVGIHDDFLALGGNSLLATQILSRVLRLFRADISQAALLGAGTIAEMAMVILESHADLAGLLADLETRPDMEPPASRPRVER